MVFESRTWSTQDHQTGATSITAHNSYLNKQRTGKYCTSLLRTQHFSTNSWHTGYVMRREGKGGWWWLRVTCRSSWRHPASSPDGTPPPCPSRSSRWRSSVASCPSRQRMVRPRCGWPGFRPPTVCSRSGRTPGSRSVPGWRLSRWGWRHFEMKMTVACKILEPHYKQIGISDDASAG